MSVGTGRLNIIILFWKYQFHCWEHINGNQTVILDSHRPFICSAWYLPDAYMVCGNIYQVPVSVQDIYQMHVCQHLPGTCTVNRAEACMSTSTRYTSTRCMYGNIYQVHIYQMHVWEHLPGAWEHLPGTHLPDACMGWEHLQYHVHIYQMHVWEHLPDGNKYCTWRMYGNIYRISRHVSTTPSKGFYRVRQLCCIYKCSIKSSYIMIFS